MAAEPPRPFRRLAVTVLAAATTVTAMAMAGVAAWDRGGTVLDRVLLVAMTACICALTHFLPALSRRPAAWLFWLVCLLGTIYGHLTFFTHAGLRAAEVRVQKSVGVVGAELQIEATREALAGIKARPVATVAREIAWTKNARRQEALREELAEAKRAARLRDGIVDATAGVSAVSMESRRDPVLVRLASVTGSSEASIALMVGIGFAILIELAGAFLWFEALRNGDEPKSRHSEAPAVRDPIEDLKDAVAAGVCKPTVAGIRVFLGCGQARALEMRRTLAA